MVLGNSRFQIRWFNVCLIKYCILFANHPKHQSMKIISNSESDTQGMSMALKGLVVIHPNNYMGYLSLHRQKERELQRALTSF
jgi:hypothetical protein